MSNGEHVSPRSAWADVRLNPNLLTASLAAETMAVEDAEGDVRAEQERLRAVVIEAQKKVDAAEGTLVERQQAVIERLADMQLVGRTMEVTAGRSLEIEANEPRNLAGVHGEVVDFEVGTVAGQPIEPADSIVLHFKADDEQIVPAGQYALRADTSQFTLSELPEPEQ